MNSFGQTIFTGPVNVSLAATLPEHPVRLGELVVLLSGVSYEGHTHLLEDLTDWETLGSYVADVMADTPSLTWRVVGGFVSGAVRLQDGGGVVQTPAGLAVNLTGIAAAVVHTHLLEDVTDFDTELPEKVFVVLSGTNSIAWSTSGASIAAVVRRKTLGALLEDADGLYVDIGVGATQAAAGNHTHVQLHSAVTILSGATVELSLAGQQLTAEVVIDPVGGLTVLLSGVGANFGVGHNQIARGDHTHDDLHDPVVAVSSSGMRLAISGTQVLSGAVIVDGDPGADRGKVVVGGNGLYVELGSGANQAAHGNHVHTPATTSTDGFLSALDKQRLDALAEGIVSVQTNALFTRDNPAIVNEYLLGQYEWRTRVYLISATARALCGTVNTTLELELDGVLTGRQLLLPSGAANTPVEVEQNLYNLQILSGTTMRWKIVDGGEIEENHYQIGLVTKLAASSVEPIILISGSAPHPDGGLVETPQGLAVRFLLEQSNYRFKSGQHQFWDQAAYDADNTRPWRALGCHDGQTIWSDPILD